MARPGRNRLPQDPLADPERVPVEEFLDGRSLDVISELHPLDPMYNHHPAMYEEAGRRALRFIHLTLMAARRPLPARIVDYGCLGGRVARFLRAGFPKAEVVAADINPDAVKYCAITFGTRGVFLDPDPARVDLGPPADLIWCGSVLPHLDHRRWPDFLSLFERSLSPGGVLVFSVFGRYIANRLRSGEQLLNLTGQEEADELLQELDDRGAGFKPTVYDGECLTSRPWVCEQVARTAGLRLVLYAENAWVTQDVVGCVKAE